ncbi:MAG: NAD(P)/FAD-dependent oxidoreductase [Sporolactobacillus sp.]
MVTNHEDIYDITVLGGGPTGLFTSFYAGMRQMRVKLIESLPQLGGQLSTLYPEKKIYDVAGFPAIKAKDLVANLTTQALQFSPKIVLGQTISQLNRLNDGVLALMTDEGVQHLTRTLIITAGVGAFSPRPLKVSHADHYSQTNLHYFINDLQQFSGRRVVILGGGDSAVDWANTLASIASHVSLVHRREAFRALESSVEQLKQSAVSIYTPYTAKAIVGDGTMIEKLVIEEVKGTREQTLALDDLIVNYGFVSAIGPIKDWGLTLEKNAIQVNSKMETNLPGIYAAGDIAVYPGKVKLIATGFGEAPTAVNNAIHYLNPNARTQPVHSSSAGDLFYDKKA